MSIVAKAFEHLEIVRNARASLSVWHIQAYWVGIQTALRSLAIEDTQGESRHSSFKSRVLSNFPRETSEFDAIWKQSMSPVESTKLFFAEWNSTATPKMEGTGNHISISGSRVVDLSKLLETAETRPLFYLAEPGITHLKAFFEGVQFVITNIGNIELKPDIVVFERWLRERTKLTSAHSWDMLLMSMCGGNGAWAFCRFFEEIREFQKEN